MKHTLITDYGFMYMEDPERVWVMMRGMGGYSLMYEDAIYSQRKIYSSYNRELLLDLRDTILEGIANGEKRIDVR